MITTIRPQWTPDTSDADKLTEIQKAFNDLVDQINNSGAHPIGEVQIQFPGQDTPASLYGGTWLNITSLYAGLFFRAEGGNALAFEAGTQTDAFQGHFHSWFLPTTGAGAVTNPALNGFASTPTLSVGSFAGAATTDGSSGTPRTASETRPINQSIRIWKKSGN